MALRCRAGSDKTRREGPTSLRWGAICKRTFPVVPARMLNDGLRRGGGTQPRHTRIAPERNTIVMNMTVLQRGLAGVMR